MFRSKKIFIALIVIAVSVFSIQSLVQAEPNLLDYSPPSVVNLKTDFGVVGNGNDETEKLQQAFTYCSQTHTTLFIPNGTYVFSNLVATGSFNIEGEHRYYTILKSKGTSGTGLDFSGLSDVKISNLTLTDNDAYEALEYGIKFGSTSGECSENIVLDNVEVRNLRRENAVACHVDNVKSISANSCVFSTLNGTGFAIDGNNIEKKAGVYNFRGTNFKAGKYGFEIKDEAIVDSIAFEGCYFGADISPEKIGNGDNIKSIIHLACHYENHNEPQVELGANCSGISWQNCTFVGYGSCKSVIKFEENGLYKGISLKDCLYSDISTEGSIINNSFGTFENCEIKLSSYGVTALPKLFANEASCETGGIQGWVVMDKYTDFQSDLKIGGARVLAIPTMPNPNSNTLNVSGEFNPGDTVYYVGEPTEYDSSDGSKYIVEGWKRITPGSDNEVGTDWVEMRVFTGN